MPNLPAILGPFGSAYWLDDDNELVIAPVNADGSVDMDNAGPIDPFGWPEEDIPKRDCIVQMLRDLKEIR